MARNLPPTKVCSQCGEQSTERGWVTLSRAGWVTRWNFTEKKWEFLCPDCNPNHNPQPIMG